ncbi:MAG TPA: ROK family transcriptional regulator [Devosia sp.]|jgi:predicted NBD/HSP70 family sugar kinase|uniref:ROK family transcriptional regulator n=1 Tax=Devosia sp. TaxID=1871048 RepID=UPI002DDD1404|nr:ROK family transcriptional regulator [Devosia sp.]HEV2515430.1 ROK family transcriptional regulator [Devosia sp.]
MSKNPKRPVSVGLPIGSNPGRNRSHNRRVVLDMVRAHGPLGRTEIARRAQLTAQAVTNIVDELVGEQMLVELGRLRSGRGQPPLQFAINPDGPMTVGVEIATDHIVAVLIDLSGQVRGQSIRPITATDPAHVLPELKRTVRSICSSVKREPVRLLGVGVVMPGPFEVEGMSSVGPATLPGWTGVDVGALASKAIGEAVVIENDATAAAVGERLYGAGRDHASFCFVYFGVGLGLGLIHEGRPLRGACGNAGEIGHLGVTPRNRPALYGADGALERFASLYALRERLNAAGLHGATIEDLQRLHEQGNAVLAAWIAEAADYLAPTVATLENLLDPETIIFGGALPDSIIDALIAALEPLPVSVATRRTRTSPRVIRGQTGQLTAALGAAALPLLETITPRLHLGSLAAAE